MGITLEELLEQRDKLQAELVKVLGRIDAYRVKCPTCRCHILPDTVCGCCAEPSIPELGDEPF